MAYRPRADHRATNLVACGTPCNKLAIEDDTFLFAVTDKQLAENWSNSKSFAFIKKRSSSVFGIVK